MPDPEIDDPTPPPVVQDAPRAIWLCYGELEHDDTHQALDQLGGVTWCEDQQHDSDVCYVRADLATAAPTASGRITTVIHGTPVECGSQAWTQLVGEVLKHLGAMPPQDLAQFYAGVLMAGMGAMAADFGHAQALAYLREMVERFNCLGTDLGGAATH